MSDSLRTHWHAFAMVALAICGIIALLLIRGGEFHAQSEYTTTVGASPDSHAFDLVAGQQFSACCVLSYSKDTQVTMRMCELEKAADGNWHNVVVAEDFGSRGDCEVVTFEAPHSGRYALEVASRSGESLHITVRYSLES